MAKVFYARGAMTKHPAKALDLTAYVLHSDYAKLEAGHAAIRAKADRLARLLRNFTIFDWRKELKGGQLHPEDVDRIELDAMEAAAALADYRGGGKP